jgi:nucleoside-diphosphate-sugar epimerase
MKRVLLTGAAGFAGSHMLRHLLANTGWTVACPVTYDHKGHLGRLESAMRGHDPGRVTIVAQNLARDLPTATLLAFGQPDCIINYASQSHVDRSITDPAPFVANNIALMANMLEYARTLPGLKAFVAAVLGGIGSVPGAMVGGLLLGVIETLVTGYLSSTYRDAIAFVILIAILLFRPTGLFGAPQTEKV